ncbi:hypothetical protein AW736_13205 [Termitidicoccus mucosus]|uniref:TonB-dependent receptor plug domain-containing protein n=2 Tax=Termitidicoccus mucosus TaxID=1184151 RepID=A0A178IJR3_9BACT|nr:hypothetical protein AW736_13205 [Opitutaceae bacterium TSB47]
MHTNVASRFAAPLIKLTGGIIFVSAIFPFFMMPLGAQTAPPAPAESEPEQVYILEEFRVESTGVKDHVKTDETLGAMRINTRMVDSPISVTVLPTEFVENFMLEEVDDQLSYVAGGNIAGERQSGTGGYVSFRGFQPQFYRNGFQRIGIAETVNLERVEFIKGPLAATFGLTEPGGVVNYVTQRPFRKRSVKVATRMGSYDYQRYEAHINTGPLDNKRVFARFDATYTDTGGFQDFFYSETLATSGAVTFQPGRNTTITVELERMRRVMNRGSAGITTSYPSTWISPVTGVAAGASVTGGIAQDLTRQGFNPLGPDFEQIRDITTLDVRVEQRLNSFMSLRVNLQWWQRPYESWTWTTTSSTSSAPSYSTATGNFNNRDPFHDKADAVTYQGQVDLLTAFKLGPTAHKLLFTCDFSDYFSEDWGWKMTTEDRNNLPAGVRTLNAANPDFSGYDRSLLTREVEHFQPDRKMTGFLLSERMALGHLALLFASCRYDRLEVDYVDYLNPQSSGKKDEGAWSWSLGANVPILGDRLVVFGNHSTSFTPSTTRDRGTGKLQDNVNASGYEAGVKGELVEGKAFWTASVYRIDRDNIPQLNALYSDEDDYESGRPQYLGSGQERSEGFEVEVFADMAPGVSVMAAGSYMNARTIKSPNDTAKEGIVLLRAPHRTGSASITYQIQSGWLRRLKLGFSARYTDRYVARYGTAGSQITGRGEITNKLQLNYGPANRIEEVRPSATIYDLSVSYPFTIRKYRHRVGLNIKNLFDKEWWSASGRKNDERAFFARYELGF